MSGRGWRDESVSGWRITAGAGEVVGEMETGTGTEMATAMATAGSDLFHSCITLID